MTSHSCNLLNMKSTLNFLLTHKERESASRTWERGVNEEGGIMSCLLQDLQEQLSEWLGRYFWEILDILDYFLLFLTYIHVISCISFSIFVYCSSTARRKVIPERCRRASLRFPADLNAPWDRRGWEGMVFSSSALLPTPGVAAATPQGWCSYPASSLLSVFLLMVGVVMNLQGTYRKWEG